VLIGTAPTRGGCRNDQCLVEITTKKSKGLKKRKKLAATKTLRPAPVPPDPC
jgi:hypothetical protein